MERRETETLLILLSRTMRFAGDHPYAATGIFGAMVGSGITYKVLEFTKGRSSVNDIFTPKAYKMALAEEDLRHLLNEPEAELRWESPDFTVVITLEQQEPLKQLPVIDYDPQ